MRLKLIRCSLSFISLLFLLPSSGLADRQSVSDPSIAEKAVPLFKNLGKHHHVITTSSKLAQGYFDQGLRLTFAFNHEEAINSFKEALRHDPDCAMCYWGIALALGPNINLPMEPSLEPVAYQNVQKARELSQNASKAERAYIEALSVRYAPESSGDRSTRDRAYAEAMRKVWQQHPRDPDAGTLFAESLMDLQPWDFWTPQGQPKGHAEEIVSILEQALALNSNHPGACHYYIHAVEASPDPSRALSCAERLPGLMPGAGHLVHMPAHIYLRLGRYQEAVERNTHAASVDHNYLEHRKLTGIYPAGYYPHNVHFLWSALTMEGRSKEAIKAARDLHTIVSWDDARKAPALEEFTPTLLFALARFGKWDEVLTVAQPPAELQYTTAIWSYTRGLAFAATGRFEQATAEQARLAELSKTMPEGQTIGVSKVSELARIAERVLAGEIAARRGAHDDAIRLFREAVQLEDAVRYYEPPLWYYPVRHSLGAVLLVAGRPAEAEQVYLEDLKQHPENGWALYGLMQSLEAQGKKEQAADVKKRFKKAWKRADVKLTASRF
jgi:tetratricopeptide (TPR) repeat protein